MTAFEMDTMALGMMRYGTDANTRTTYSPLLLRGYNMAQREMARRVLHPKRWDTVTLGADKTFLTTALGKTPAKILMVARGTDTQNLTREFAFEQWAGATVYVPDADASEAVWVYFEYIPTDMVNPNPTTGTGATSPDACIPAEFHDAIVYKAVGHVLVGEDDPNAAYYNNLFEDALATMHTPVPQTRIANVYANL